MDSRPSCLVLFWRVFIPFVLGFFLTSIYRTVTAVFAPVIASSGQFTIHDVALSTSIYFLTFSLMQVPTGILLDRFGTRRVQAVLFLIGGVGSLIYGLSASSWCLSLGRGILGIGMAGGLMAGFTALRTYYPKERTPFWSGALVAFGSLGVVAATTPTEWLLRYWTWGEISILLAGMNVIIAAITFFVVPERPDIKDKKPLSIKEQTKGICHIFGDRFFWRIAPLTITVLSCFISFQSLWASSWLHAIDGLPPLFTSYFLLAFAIAMIFGTLISGILIDLLVRIHVSPLWVVGIGCLLSIISQILILTGLIPASYTLWSIFGFFALFSMLNYAILSHHFPPEYAGRANTALNLLVFIFIFLFQNGFGYVLKLWPIDATGAYPPPAYRVAFGIFIILEILSWLWFSLNVKAKLGQKT